MTAQADQIVQRHLTLARSLARKAAKRYRLDVDDAEGEAMVALLEAGMSFDPDRGSPSHTHVTVEIRRHLKEWAKKAKLADQVATGHRVDEDAEADPFDQAVEAASFRADQEQLSTEDAVAVEIDAVDEMANEMRRWGAITKLLMGLGRKGLEAAHIIRCRFGVVPRPWAMRHLDEPEEKGPGWTFEEIGNLYGKDKSTIKRWHDWGIAQLRRLAGDSKERVDALVAAVLRRAPATASERRKRSDSRLAP